MAALTGTEIAMLMVLAVVVGAVYAWLVTE